MSVNKTPDNHGANRRALVTGGAGFIGSHLVDALLARSWHVTVIDNFDPFYSESMKRDNLLQHSSNPLLRLVEADIRSVDCLRASLDGNYHVIVHLAAKAGVRPSIEEPGCYQDVNVGGTQNMLELAKEWGVGQFVFASSSSVYGVNPNVPWSESDHVLCPISPYASTKVSGELLGHVYSYLYRIRFIALRFFTVYGPRQRPDLAINKFARLLLSRQPIPLFGDGSSRRDYTYVGDILQGILAAIDYTATPYEVINLGNNRTVSLSEMAAALGDVFKTEPLIERYPQQPGDVPQTWADISKARRLLKYEPRTDFRAGLRAFAEWMNTRGKIQVRRAGASV